MKLFKNMPIIFLWPITVFASPDYILVSQSLLIH